MGRWMIDAEINGLIVWRETAHSVRLERSLLMLDAASWAQWQRARSARRRRGTRGRICEGE